MLALGREHFLLLEQVPPHSDLMELNRDLLAGQIPPDTPLDQRGHAHTISHSEYVPLPLSISYPSLEPADAIQGHLERPAHLRSPEALLDQRRCTVLPVLKRIPMVPNVQRFYVSL